MGKSFGTEKIEEEAKSLFPDAKVARMDVDSMRGKNSHAELFDALSKNKVDILVGTQMVVKGLDFAAVSVVGILSADALLSYPDFRVNERAFQLMEQVAGRAGRADGEGVVLIQAYNTKHPVLEFVRNHDVRTFYRFEIQYRNAFFYPPFSRLFRVIFRHHDEIVAMEAACVMADNLKPIPDIVVQGPAPALVARVKNQYIHEIWIKCARSADSIAELKKALKNERERILSIKGNTRLQIVVDVDPY